MRRLLLAFHAVIPLSCAGIVPELLGWDCVVAPVEIASLSEGLAIRGPMRIQANDRLIHLQVVARRSGEELVVAGIADYGVRVFSVRQEDRSLEVEGAASREFAQVARWVADALHRALWIQAPGPRTGAVVAWAWENEEVTEIFDGARRSREFRRAHEAAPVRVLYLDHGFAVHNSWCGYDAYFSATDASGSATQ